MKFAAGSRLGVIRPANTNAVVLFRAALATEVLRFVVCNVTSADARFDIYHTSASVYDQFTALWYNRKIRDYESFDWGSRIGAGIQLRKGDAIAFKSRTASACTIHAYGVTQDSSPGGGLL